MAILRLQRKDCGERRARGGRKVCWHGCATQKLAADADHRVHVPPLASCAAPAHEGRVAAAWRCTARPRWRASFFFFLTKGGVRFRSHVRRADRDTYEPLQPWRLYVRCGGV